MKLQATLLSICLLIATAKSVNYCSEGLKQAAYCSYEATDNWVTRCVNASIEGDAKKTKCVALTTAHANAAVVSLDGSIYTAAGASTTAKITECKDGYYLKSDKCVNCNVSGSSAKYWNGTECKDSTSVSGCANYENEKDGCSICDNGKTLDSNASPNTCKAPDTPVANCKTFQTNDGTKCTECNTNYFLDANECKTVTTPVTNCDEHSSATECESCKEGFWKKDATTCEALTVANCATGKGAKDKCQRCKTGFAEKSETECVAIPTGCSGYSGDKCYRCNYYAGYYATDAKATFTYDSATYSEQVCTKGAVLVSLRNAMLMLIALIASSYCF